jgi:hypothetical protein
MTRAALVFLIAASDPALAASPAASSQTCAARVVHGFFDAFEHRDFKRALGFTSGSANAATQKLLATLERRAAAQHAVLEIKVRRLELAERAPNALGQIPVDVAYDIDIFGRKWFLRWFGRRLSGKASFYIDAGGPSIVVIDGHLDA